MTSNIKSQFGYSSQNVPQQHSEKISKWRNHRNSVWSCVLQKFCTSPRTRPQAFTDSQQEVKIHVVSLPDYLACDPKREKAMELNTSFIWKAPPQFPSHSRVQGHQRFVLKQVIYVEAAGNILSSTTFQGMASIARGRIWLRNIWSYYVAWMSAYGSSDF